MTQPLWKPRSDLSVQGSALLAEVLADPSRRRTYIEGDLLKEIRGQELTGSSKVLPPIPDGKPPSATGAETTRAGYLRRKKGPLSRTQRTWLDDYTANHPKNRYAWRFGTRPSLSQSTTSVTTSPKERKPPMTAKKSTAKKSTAKKSTPRTHTTPTKAISQVARMTRQMRSENGLTQKGLAKRLGFKNPGAQSQLSEWERGTFDMVFPPKQRGILARLLKVSYLDLCRKLTQDTEAFEKMGLGLLRKSTSKKTGSTKPTTKSKPYEFQGQTEATPVKDTAIKAVSVVPVKVVPAKAAVSVRAKVPEKDFVAEIVAERTRKNPEFPGLVAETSKKIRNSLFKSPRYVGQIAALISHYRKSSGLKSGEVAVSFGLPVGNPGVCTLSSWENGWCNIRLSKVQRILMIQVLGLNPGDFDRKLQEDERGRKKVLARRRVRRIELKRKGMLAVYAHAKSPQASGNQKSTDGSGRTVRNYNSARDHKPLRNDPTTIDGSVDRERSDLAKLLRTRSGERFALGDTEGAIVLRAEAQLLEGVTAS